MCIISFDRFRKECHKFFELWSRFSNFVAYRDGDLQRLRIGMRLLA